MMTGKAALARALCDASYTLRERLPNGDVLSDDYVAASDVDAIERAEAVWEGGVAELWCGRVLIKTWDPA